MIPTWILVGLAFAFMVLSLVGGYQRAPEVETARFLSKLIFGNVLFLAVVVMIPYGIGALTFGKTGKRVPANLVMMGLMVVLFLVLLVVSRW